MIVGRAAGRPDRTLLPTFILGFGLGGFFDGILLHQVLQWHHLLSLVPGEAFRDMGTQILWDGLFHVLMYLVTGAGLWLLWRRRRDLADRRGRAILGGTLLGFAAWNLVDVGFFHWTLGIHRIRVGVPDPMLYDVAWLSLFGLVPLAAAWALLRRPGGSGGGRAGAAVALTALVAAPLAALPQGNSNSALVLLPPAGNAGQGFDLARTASAPVLWMDPAGRMMAVQLPPQTSARLYAAGALFVTRSPALAGCVAALAA